NRAIVEVAERYEVPLINLWAAAQALPEYGLDGDSVHMQHDGFRFIKFDTGSETFYGVPLRNLLSIYMLDQLRHTLNME
ncbi:MAG: hypothetical protein H7175_25900, partial [Burkholderiales bacterium]|nr:hypothetical protein [Anaerolineae bacterium]